MNEIEIVESGREIQGRNLSSAVFDPDRLQVEMERDLPKALRDLADAIESDQIDGKLMGFIPYGFNADRRDSRAHVMVKLHLAAEIRQQLRVSEADAVREVHQK
jgi:hypothetical protein